LNIEKRAYKFGIDLKRCYLRRRCPKQKHLARIALADLSLDTLRVNGAASTSDALWAGVPVLTVRGRHFASRMSTSILIAIGLDSLVAGDLKEFETRAVALSNNGSRVKRMKKMLKKKSDESHLFDVRGFVSNLEQSYEIMRNRHLAGKNPCQIEVKAFE
jgi:protein O-GlcNAc transferase